MGGFSCAPRCPAFLTFRDSPALLRQESDGYPVRPVAATPTPTSHSPLLDPSSNSPAPTSLPEIPRKWSRAVAPVLAHHASVAMGRLRRSVEQQELWHRFVDKLVEQKIGEEAAPAARRDESGPITLFGTAAASRREPTGELGAAALDRAASEARAAADDQPTWQLQRRADALGTGNSFALF